MSREPNRDRTIDSDAESYYGGASDGVPGLRSRRDEYDPDVDAAPTGDGDGRKGDDDGKVS